MLRLCISYDMLLKYISSDIDCVVMPHAMSCGGYKVFDPSVSQSAVSQSVKSWVFLVGATPLKLLNRIWWDVVARKFIMSRCAYSQEILIKVFTCMGVMPLLTSYFAKMEYTIETVCQRNFSETAQKNFVNFVIQK